MEITVEDGIGQDSPASENSQEVVEVVESAPETGEIADNPAWAPFKESLDPISYHAIKPHLAKMDGEFQKQVTQSNRKYDGFKEFLDEGLDPAYLRQAAVLAKNLETSPEEVYARLGEFLQQNGRLPQTKQELAQAVTEGAEDDEYEDPQEKRIRELEAQLQGITGTWQQMAEEAQQRQVYEQTYTQATQRSQAELAQIRQAHPEFTRADFEQVLDRADTILTRTGKPASLVDLAEEVAAYRSSVLTAPRPGGSAPRLPGAGGGVPSTASKPMGELSKEERVKYIASLIGG